MRAPCTTNWPTPPPPRTSTEEPAETRAANSTEPTPVSAAQPSSAASRSGIPPPVGSATFAATTIRSASAPVAVPRYTVPPSNEIPVVPSTSVPAPIAWCSGTQAAGRPRRQSPQTPHDGAQESTTSSPGASPVTALPTDSITPAPSWPSTIGVGRWNSPFTWWRSVPQIPTAAIETTTSSGPALPRSTSTTSNGCPTARKSAAAFPAHAPRSAAVFTAAQSVTTQTFVSA